jgi:hypothetical protein
MQSIALRQIMERDSVYTCRNQPVNLRSFVQQWSRPTGDQLIIWLAFLYLGFPIAIFLLGWLHLWIAIPTTILLILGTILALSSFAYQNAGGYLDKRYLIIALVGAMIWVMLSGIGGYGHQNVDFHYRNAVFHDLINHPWPVVYDYSQDAQLSNQFGGKGMLVYYFGFWLTSAAVGKVLGWEWANFTLYLWAVAGVVVTLLLIARFLGRSKGLIVIVFMLASGMDFFGYLIAGPDVPQGLGLFHRAWILLVNTIHLDDWLSFNVQFSSFTTQLFWVFNQALPAWIGTLLLLEDKNKKSIFFIWMLVLFFAPLPALGLIPLAAYQVFSRSDPKAETTINLRDLFSMPNLCAGILITIIIAFFSLTVGSHQNGFLWSSNDLPWNWILLLLLFYCLEFLLVGILLFKRNAVNQLLILVLITLSLIPLFSYGRFNDFAMRASIPSLLVLLLIALQAYFGESHTIFSAAIVKKGLLALFLIGCITPIHEIHRSVVNIIEARGFPKMKDQWKTFDRALDPQDMPEMGNFVARNPESGVFYQLLMKQ